MNRSWTAVKADLRQLFAPSLSGRLDVHVTFYRTQRDEGRAWFTWDGVEIYSSDDAKFWLRTYPLSVELRSLGVEDPWDDAIATSQAEGITSVSRLYESMQNYLGMSSREALQSPDPFVRGLALLDRRVGKRTLRAPERDVEVHPFVRRMLDLRREAEGIASTAVIA